MIRARSATVEHVSELYVLTKPELIERWAKLYGSPPPKRAGRDLLVRVVAHKTQERNKGRLKPAARRRLKQLTEQQNDHGKIEVARTPPFKPGTRLIREWRGKTHEVTVTEDGFIWRDQRYKSLSKVAGMITGSHRSGPAFFGLNKSGSLSTPKEPANG
jgi:hypothetical protein